MPAPPPAAAALPFASSHLPLLADLVERLNRAETKDEALGAALDGMTTLLGADRASILIFGADDRVHFAAWRGLSAAYRRAVDGHSPWQRHEVDAQPIVVEDLETSAFSPELVATIRSEGIVSLAFFPLARHDQLLGKFMTYYLQPHQFRAADLHLGRMVALHLAAALGRLLDHEQLAQREALFRQLFESSPEAIALLDDAQVVQDVNGAFERLFGYRQSECRGVAIDRLVVPEEHATEAAELGARTLGGATVVTEVQRRRKDGSCFFANAQAYPIVIADRRVGLFVTYDDISERKRAEEALRRSEERYRLFVERSSDGIWRADAAPPMPISLGEEEQIEYFYAHGAISECNATMARMYGFADAREMVGTRFADLLPASDPHNVEFLRAFVRSGYRLADAESHEVDRHGRPKFFVNSLVGIVRDGLLHSVWGGQRDVTTQRALEEQLRQAQKMEAVGRLAGGIAHDFNNLLTAITGYSELLLGRFAGDDPRRGEVEEILRAGHRASELTRQLLALSRRQALAPRAIDVDRVLQEMESLLRRLLGEDLELEIRLGAAPALLRCDPGQLEQVILNLAVNARDAMPGGGRLEIATRQVAVDEEKARCSVDLAAGSYVELRFTDTGVGMPAAVLEHIFEPFFTTKPHGQGTGLGLSTVYGIVRQSGGHIEVRSGPDEGSTFTLLFPEDRATASAEVEPLAAPAPRPSGRETVLLVEDEPAVRGLLAATLTSHGYDVLEAGDGVAALAAAARARVPIDVLLTDLVLPRMGGAELAQRLTAERPDLAVLYISGYADRSPALSADGTLTAGAAYLQKPFGQDQLLRVLRGVLEAAGRRPRAGRATGASR